MEVTQKQMSSQKIQKKPGNIPEYLIYEILHGEIIYYKNYQEVIKGKKTLESIMGSSTLQAVLVFFFNELLIKSLDTEKYYILSSEAGLHIDAKNNLANDIAVYDTTLLTPEKINNQYANVPPKLVIEIDVKADLSNAKNQDYVHKKTQKLLDFGSEKVIWVFTETQKVMTATPTENWQIMDWNKDVVLFENLTFNIAKYLDKRRIEVGKEDI